MAYELHNPRYTEKESSFISNNPILILHGFLGSRRENRCLGRYVPSLKLLYIASLNLHLGSLPKIWQDQFLPW